MARPRLKKIQKMNNGPKAQAAKKKEKEEEDNNSSIQAEAV